MPLTPCLRGNSLRGVAQQPVAKLGIDPGPCHHPRAVARSHLRLVGVDQHVQSRRVDVTFLGQYTLQCSHARLRLAEFAVLVVRIVIVIVVMMVVVVVGVMVVMVVMVVVWHGGLQRWITHLCTFRQCQTMARAKSMLLPAAAPT